MFTMSSNTLHFFGFAAHVFQVLQDDESGLAVYLLLTERQVFLKGGRRAGVELDGQRTTAAIALLKAPLELLLTPGHLRLPPYQDELELVVGHPP